MNERLTLQDLVDILAQKQNISKKDAELFLRELFGLITETISIKDYVRIKDFGTFKLVAVSSRKSVDVNTGEPIEIPPHYKLSFSPEKSFRELINSPFAHIESVLLDDNVDNQDTLKTVDVVPKADTLNKVEPIKEKVEEPSKPIFVEPVVQETKKVEEDLVTTPKDNSIVDSKIEDIDLGSNFDDHDILVDEIITDTIITDTHSKDDIKEITKPNKETVSSIEEDEDIADFLKENKSGKSKGIIIGLCALVVVICAIFFWMKNNKAPENIVVINDTVQVENSSKENESLPKDRNNASESVNNTADKDKVDAEKQKAELAKKQEAEKIEKERIEAEKKKQEEQKAAAKSTIVKLENGETLQSLAKKHFGNRIFWVYIYEDNTDVIKKPDAIFAGMDLKIPAPSKYKIDAKDTSSIERATQKQKEIFAKFAK